MTEWTYTRSLCLSLALSLALFLSLSFSLSLSSLCLCLCLCVCVFMCFRVWRRCGTRGAPGSTSMALMTSLSRASIQAVRHPPNPTLQPHTPYPTTTHPTLQPHTHTLHCSHSNYIPFMCCTIGIPHTRLKRIVSNCARACVCVHAYVPLSHIHNLARSRSVLRCLSLAPCLWVSLCVRTCLRLALALTRSVHVWMLDLRGRCDKWMGCVPVKLPEHQISRRDGHQQCTRQRCERITHYSLDLDRAPYVLYGVKYIGLVIPLV